MKTKNLYIVTFIGAILLFGCQKSSTDEFNEANGDVAKKTIKVFQIINLNNSHENKTYTINYDGENKVSSVTDGTSNGFLNYNSSNALKTVTGNDETFDIDELYQSPYDAFESGKVLEYDDKLNPVKIEVFEDGYGSNKFVGQIIYDPNPNPFFYTLQAAGIINVLDRVDFNFGYTNPAITKARKLLPYNNIRAMIFKDVSGVTKYEVQIDYNYDEDAYPSHAHVNALSEDESSTYTLLYTYR